jgi:hypothetical protein
LVQVGGQFCHFKIGSCGILCQRFGFGGLLSGDASLVLIQVRLDVSHLVSFLFGTLSNLATDF